MSGIDELMYTASTSGSACSSSHYVALAERMFDAIEPSAGALADEVQTRLQLTLIDPNELSAETQSNLGNIGFAVHARRV